MKRLDHSLSLETKGCCVWETRLENVDQVGKEMEKYKEEQ
jgi:hypothetical protein